MRDILAIRWTERDIGGKLSFSMAGTIGAAYAVILLGPSAIFGSTAFWQLPSGLIGDALDIRNTLAGY